LVFCPNNVKCLLKANVVERPMIFRNDRRLIICVFIITFPLNFRTNKLNCKNNYVLSIFLILCTNNPVVIGHCKGLHLYYMVLEKIVQIMGGYQEKVQFLS
jgi:hypothetical protein